ncbi:site-2 protease family protein [Actinoallomurus sp. CA-150999]|uniref:site-2 protease family protein n=1 Tax=Actinoallomurus sp. CA-150999 TaxID=3239887 RepID=UPI003D9203D0
MSDVSAVRSSVRPSPAFLFVLGLFALSGLAVWRYGISPDRTARLFLFVFVVSGWIVSLCLHEFGHAFFAYRSGDRSVATKGYLTLNPLKYGDITLSFLLPVLFVLLGGIGLPGGAVYIDRGAIPGKIRHSLISAAGPIANLLFAIVLGVVITNLAKDPAHLLFWTGAAFLAFLQVTAAVLNLLPVPGLDGFGIVEPYLPRSWVAQADRIGGYAFMALLALLWIPAVNEQFFSLVYHLTDLFGIDQDLVSVGHGLFRFWENVSFAG